jgi:serine/threonine protein kinase
LKPENILIDSEGYALLTDFGLSKEGMTTTAKAKSLCGTAEYLPPEVLEKERAYGKECDWWSFGCVVYEMLTGHPPFYSTDRKQMFDNIKARDVKFYDFHSPASKDLILKLLKKDPSQRLGDASLIMQHEFFAGVDWDLLMQRKTGAPYIPVLKHATDTSHFDQQQTGIPVFSPP